MKLFRSCLLHFNAYEEIGGMLLNARDCDCSVHSNSSPQICRLQRHDHLEGVVLITNFEEIRSDWNLCGTILGVLGALWKRLWRPEWSGMTKVCHPRPLFATSLYRAESASPVKALLAILPAVLVPSGV